jgi:intracellular septation protein
MKNLFHAASFLLLDLASTFIFLIVVLITKNVTVAIVLGMVFGVAQIAWEFARKKPISVMQWLSLVLVVGFGGVSLLTNDPRFVMIKPSLIYLIIGAVMLKPGWMTRYLPEVAKEIVPDIALVFGFVWAGLMFFSAALNIFVALKFNVVTWAGFMATYGTVSKLGLFAIQYTTMRFIAVRRRRAQMTAVLA